MLLKYVLLCDYIVLFLNFVITIIGKSKKNERYINKAQNIYIC